MSGLVSEDGLHTVLARDDGILHVRLVMTDLSTQPYLCAPVTTLIFACLPHAMSPARWYRQAPLLFAARVTAARGGHLTMTQRLSSHLGFGPQPSTGQLLPRRWSSVQPLSAVVLWSNLAPVVARSPHGCAVSDAIWNSWRAVRSIV